MTFCQKHVIGLFFGYKLKKLTIMITLFKDPIFAGFDKLLETSRFTTYPQTSVKKTETEYHLHVGVPGLTKDDLKIFIKDGVLKISYEKDENSETGQFVTSFTKSYVIPEDVKEKDIEGKVENGVLEIKLPLDKKKSLERYISLN